MKVDVSFTNAKVYDITRVDVVKGQKFTLNTDYTGISKWFADNDPVLALDVNGNNAGVEATAVGTSGIQIQDENKTVLKELIISVVDAVIPMATKLNLTADAPAPK